MTTVMSLVGVVLFPIALVWLLPALAELVAVGRALARPKGGTRDVPSGTPQRFLFLVPAHDESLLIERCVQSLVGMRPSGATVAIVVIADNCEDDTASRARAAGATVLERRDPERRGKPHAIAWAMAQYPLVDWDAVVIVDADTVVEPAFADALAAAGPARERAAQGYFGLSNEYESWLSILAGVLARVRYEGQYPLKQRAGLNCPLTGNGMCLGTGFLARVGWPSESLTENWELYARATVGGEHIVYVRGAVLHAQEAHSVGRSSTQRTRWQAGRMAVLRHYCVPLLKMSGVAQKLDALAELSSPGPIVHAALAIVLALALALMPTEVTRVVALLFALSVLPMIGWTAAAWIRDPNRLAVAGALARLPFYAVWRVGVAVLALKRGRGLEWKRSPRHAEHEPPA
jgi:1,2-diacylglycerol 3-beta-glucosyltransferase